MYALALAFASFALEAGATDSDITLTNPLGSLTTGGLIERISTAVITIATPIVGIMVLIGGFKIMTAQGKAESIDEGRKIIQNAAIGFAIILLAKFTVDIVQSILQV
jgi:hypothetical protein